MAGSFSGGNALRALALGAGFALLLVFAGQERQHQGAPTEAVVEVVVGDWHFRAEPEVVVALEGMSRRHVTEAGSGAQTQLDVMVATELDRIFSVISDRLPAYADWHYSLGGEYARLAVLMFARTGLVGDDTIRRKAIELIFEDAGFEQAIGGLDARAIELLGDHVRVQRAAWLADVLDILDSGIGRQPGDRPLLAASLSFEPLLTGFEALRGEAFETRLMASTGVAGAGALAAPMAARVIGRKMAAVGSLRPVASRTAARGATKAGTAGSGGLLGCAATGPAALPCMIVVGGAVWLATDMLMLGADEWLNREALIADLQQGLAEMRDELEPALVARYAGAINDWEKSMQSELSRTFSPMDAISGR